MTHLKQIIQNYFHKEENSTKIIKQLKNVEHNVLFMIKELKTTEVKVEKLKKSPIWTYPKPIYAYVFIVIISLISIGIFFFNFSKNLPVKTYQVTIGDKKIGFKTGLGSNSTKAKASPTPIATPTVFTNEPTLNLTKPVYYIADLLTFGNIKALMTYESTHISTLLKLYQQWGDFQIVTHQSDFSYEWTIDNPNIAQITPFEACTNGIAPPCPQDHLAIMAKNEGFTYIRVRITKKSENLLVAAGTFNLTVIPRESALTATIEPTINPTSTPAITNAPTAIPTLTTDPSLSGKCTELYELIQKSYASSCGQANYDVRADLNKDRVISGADFSLYRTILSLANSESECASKLADITTICP